MFIIGLIVGLLVGVVLGVLTFALCVAASDADDRMESEGRRRCGSEFEA